MRQPLMLRPLILLAATLATPAAAQSAAPAAVVAAAPADPARLAVARRIATRIWPDGSMEKMMGAMTSQMTGQITDRMLDVPLRDLAAAGGLSESDRAKMSKASLRQVMAIVDPAFEQRIAVMQRVMMPELGRITGKLEPEFREAMAVAYTRRFTVAQLGEIEAFFATPTGGAYAAASMQIAADPEYLAKMQQVVPLVLKELPAIMAKVKAENDKLPPARTFKDLTPAERDDIARILGIQGVPHGAHGGAQTSKEKTQ